MPVMREIVKEVAELIRVGEPVLALNYVVSKAPESVREKAKHIFDDPKVIEEIDGDWGKLLALIYYSHLLKVSSNDMSRRGIAGQAVSALTGAKLSRQLESKELEAIFLLSSGKALSLMGMKDRAEVCYIKAEELLRDLVKEDESWFKELSDVLNDLGIIYVESGDRDKGRAFLEEALEIRRKLAEKNPAFKPMLAQTLNNLASLYKDLRIYDKSEEYFAKAESIYRELVEVNENYRVDLAVVLCNYASLFRVIKEHKKAEELYLEALSIFEELAKKNEFYKSAIADVCMYLSGLYKDMGDFEKSKEFFERANKTFAEFTAKMTASSESSAS